MLLIHIKDQCALQTNRLRYNCHKNMSLDIWFICQPHLFINSPYELGADLKRGKEHFGLLRCLGISLGV